MADEARQPEERREEDQAEPRGEVIIEEVEFDVNGAIEREMQEFRQAQEAAWEERRRARFEADFGGQRGAAAGQPDGLARRRRGMPGDPILVPERIIMVPNVDAFHREMAALPPLGEDWVREVMPDGAGGFQIIDRRMPPPFRFAPPPRRVLLHRPEVPREPAVVEPRRYNPREPQPRLFMDQFDRPRQQRRDGDEAREGGEQPGAEAEEIVAALGARPRRVRNADQERELQQLLDHQAMVRARRELFDHPPRLQVQMQPAAVEQRRQQQRDGDEAQEEIVAALGARPRRVQLNAAQERELQQLLDENAVEEAHRALFDHPPRLQAQMQPAAVEQPRHEGREAQRILDQQRLFEDAALYDQRQREAREQRDGDEPRDGGGQPEADPVRELQRLAEHAGPRQPRFIAHDLLFDRRPPVAAEQRRFEDREAQRILDQQRLFERAEEEEFEREMEREWDARRQRDRDEQRAGEGRGQPDDEINPALDPHFFRAQRPGAARQMNPPRLFGGAARQMAPPRLFRHQFVPNLEGHREEGAGGIMEEWGDWDDDRWDRILAARIGIRGRSVTDEMIAAAVVMREEDEKKNPSSTRYSRLCPICYIDNPGTRAVYSKCGHIVCYPCAVETAKREEYGGKCPTCRSLTGFVKLFEDEQKDVNEEKK